MKALWMTSWLAERYPSDPLYHLGNLRYGSNLSFADDEEDAENIAMDSAVRLFNDGAPFMNFYTSVVIVKYETLEGVVKALDESGELDAILEKLGYGVITGDYVAA